MDLESGVWCLSIGHKNKQVNQAIEISRQIARHIKGKAKSMTLHDSYLGAYTSVILKESGWRQDHNQ